MDWIAVDGIGIDFFVVIEHDVPPERARAYNVTIRENVAIHGISTFES